MKSIFPILLIVLLSSCHSEKKQEIPTGVMSSEKFTSVMIDVQLLEAMRAQGVEMIAPEEGVEGEYSKIFSKHHISESEFRTSYKFYREHPDKMEKVFEQVLDSLSKLDAEVKQRYSAQRKAQTDSLSRARQEIENNREETP